MSADSRALDEMSISFHLAARMLDNLRNPDWKARNEGFARAECGAALRRISRAAHRAGPDARIAAPNVPWELLGSAIYTFYRSLLGVADPVAALRETGDLYALAGECERAARLLSPRPAKRIPMILRLLPARSARYSLNSGIISQSNRRWRTMKIYRALSAFCARMPGTDAEKEALLSYLVTAASAYTADNDSFTASGVLHKLSVKYHLSI